MIVRASLTLATGVAVVVATMRVAEHLPGRLEFGSAPVTRVGPELASSLDALEKPLHLVLAISHRDALPASMRHLERDVTALLRACASFAPKRVTVQVIDPDRNEVAADWLASRKLAPFRVADITGDQTKEEFVWAGLGLAYGTEVSAIAPLRATLLPRLQSLIVAHLEEMQRPRLPRIALSAPDSDGDGDSDAYSELETLLTTLGTVQRVSLNGTAPWPEEIDALWWMEPRNVTATRLAEFERHLAVGRPVVLAGPSPKMTEIHGEHGDDWSLGRPTSDFEHVAAAVGLDVDGEGLLLDARSVMRGGKLVPYEIQSIAPNQDFRSLGQAPQGHLRFVAPPALSIRHDHVDARQWLATVLAASSDQTTRQPAPTGTFPAERLLVGAGVGVAKQPLMVHVRGRDPARGPTVVCATSTPFRNGSLHEEGHAHTPLVRALVRSMSRRDRLAYARAASGESAPLPALSWASAWMWRALCIGLVPGLLLLVAGCRWPRGTPRRSSAHKRSLRGPVLLSTGVVVIMGLVASGVGAHWSIDLTGRTVGGLSPHTVRLLDDAPQSPISLTLFFSDASESPATLRAPLRRLRQRLRDLARRSGWSIETPLDDAAWERVQPAMRTSQEDALTLTRTFHASVVVTSGDESVTLNFHDATAIEHAEFRLVATAFGLQQGGLPHVGFASDSPRPSATEAYEEYQAKHRIPPKGTDVFRDARELLEQSGFRVTHINPRDPTVPGDLDALVWLQPRRRIEGMLNEVVQFLHDGGNVLIAAQHFSMQAYQYRGRGFDLMYWPEPQTPDIDELYFPSIGVTLERHLVLDQRHHAADLDARVHGRGRDRQFESQKSALPFLVQTASEHHNASSSMVRNIGDQSFASGSSFTLNPDLLRAFHLTATPLITTSERAWTHRWEAGYIDPATLQEPSGPEGRFPLAVRIDGRFPRPSTPLTSDRFAPDDTPPPPTLVHDATTGGEGTLVMLAASQMLRNDMLRHPDFRGDRLLTSIVAGLCLDHDLAALASSRAVEPGFERPEEATRLGWRVAVPGVPALLFLGLSVVWWSVRRGRRTR